MTKGSRAYGEKDRRKIRRINHVKKDLRTPQYRMRRVESKKDRDEKYPLDPTKDFDETE